MTQPSDGSGTDRKPSRTLVDRLKDHPVIGGFLLLGAVTAALGTVFGPVNRELHERRASSPEAEYERLAELGAGVTLARFDEVLDDEPDLQTSTEGGLRRNIYKRPYVYVLAVTNPDSTVVSFAVMVREPDFHPDFGGVVLGKTVPFEAWETPGALVGACGNPGEYFEVSQGPAGAMPKVRAVGFSGLGGHDDTQFDPLCQADEQLDACDAYLVGDAALSTEAVDCFTSSPSGQRLRSTLRPNLYAEGMPNQDLSYELISIRTPEVTALDT